MSNERPEHGRAGSREATQTIRTVSSVPELAREIEKRGTNAVVYEAPTFRHKDVLIKHRALLDHILLTCLNELRGRRTTDTPSFSYVLMNVKNLISERPTLTARDVAELHVAIDAVLADLQDILTQFGKYKIRYISVKQANDLTSLRNQEWHTDEDAGRLHIVRTYSGPSTEYAQGAPEQKSMTFKEGAISVHNEVALHRAPYYSDSKPRFAIVVRLDPA